jgi:hypothetical protein
VSLLMAGNEQKNYGTVLANSMASIACFVKIGHQVLVVKVNDTHMHVDSLIHACCSQRSSACEALGWPGKSHYGVHQSPPICLIASQIKPVHTFIHESLWLQFVVLPPARVSLCSLRCCSQYIYAFLISPRAACSTRFIRWLNDDY